MSDASFRELLAEFEQSLVDCRQLYLNSARECATNYPHLIKRSQRDFITWMDDLHKGVLVKLYCEMALVDGQWTSSERQLARALFIHIWDRDLSGAELKEATRGLTQKAAQLKWSSLVRPFAQMAPLRERVGELATILMRLANMIAKADGLLTEKERHLLARLQEDFDQYFGMATGEDRPPPLPTMSKQALQELGKEARGVREQFDLRESRPPEKKPVLSPEQRLADALQQLDALIGLETVKTEIRTLTNFLRVQKQREAAGLPKTDVCLHTVFAGNPGTGKTTVARILGQIFGAMGMVKSGHLVETDRSGLVAGYAGQTATKTNKRIDEALDGVLFIDEAYSLVGDRSDDAYGREALQVLLKRMEDDRQRLVVILAGYPEPMERLIEANPGLSSRFSRTLIFDDYSPANLGRIFERLCDVHHYRLDARVRARLLVAFDWLYRNRDERFGNGRLARNTFEDSIRRLANRIADIAPVTKELLTSIQSEDIHLSVPDEIQRAETDAKVSVVCPGCRKRHVVACSFLGQTARCKDCKREFPVGWADLVADDSTYK
jgi:SpoVK/Ycf46/Vps4 family AAA+-type ATPase